MVRNGYPMSYVGPGPCHGHEIGVCDARCECGRAQLESFRSRWSKDGEGKWAKTDEIRF